MSSPEQDETGTGLGALLDSSLLTRVLWGAAGASLLVLAAFGVHFFAAAQGDVPCEALAGALPESVPETTVLRIRDANGNRLSADIAPDVRNVTEEAVAVFGFEDRVIVDLGSENISIPADAHVLPVSILEGQTLREGIFSTAGKMCGNLLLLEYQGDEALDRRIAVHELGHFLGLCHKNGTWMTPSADDGGPETDRFSEPQRAVLDHWADVGEEYIPHWERNEAGDLNCD